MNQISFIKKEVYTGSSSLVHSDVGDYIPQPIEGLHVAAPQPFLSKTYDMVEDESTDEIVCWSSGNNSFIVWDAKAFAVNLLPKYFKHNNFSSFVRQLNTYGFRKVDPDKWEFANEGFLKGKKHLLKTIRRRKTLSNYNPQCFNQTLDSCVEVGRFGLDGEIERLRRDKHVLLAELVRLRQQQQNTKSYLQAMEERLRVAEIKHQQAMSFLVWAIRNPSFMEKMGRRRKEIEEEISKKRRKKIVDGSRSFGVEECLVQERETGNNIRVKLEGQELYEEVSDFDNLGLEKLTKLEDQEKFLEEDNYDGGFWKDLMNDDICLFYQDGRFGFSDYKTS